MKAVMLCLLAVAVVVPISSHADGVSPDRAYVNAVIDHLVEVGVLTQEQADGIKEAGIEAAEAAVEVAAASAEPPKTHWYDTMKISGYTQGRFQYYTDRPNRAGDIESEFVLRRSRLKMEFKPTSNTKVVAEATYEGDAADVGIKKMLLEYKFGSAGEHALTFGQQDVPFGFETPQSSSVRLPLERNYLTRRQVPGEVDLGLVYRYTTPADHALFDLSKKAHFGCGDSGNLSLGFFNGQGEGAAEENGNKHFVARLAKPFLLGENQYAEVGGSYYAGRFFNTNMGRGYEDNVLNVYGFWAPNPFGLQAEYYTGETMGADLNGWYGMGIWRASERGTAFVRYEDYSGRRKRVDRAPAASDYDRERTSIGYAYELDSNTRLTAEYDIEHIANGDYNDNMFGLQIQTKY